jgi:hypothetical protein
VDGPLLDGDGNVEGAGFVVAGVVALGFGVAFGLGVALGLGFGVDVGVVVTGGAGSGAGSGEGTASARHVGARARAPRSTTATRRQRLIVRPGKVPRPNPMIPSRSPNVLSVLQPSVYPALGFVTVLV